MKNNSAAKLRLLPALPRESDRPAQSLLQQRERKSFASGEKTEALQDVEREDSRARRGAINDHRPICLANRKRNARLSRRFKPLAVSMFLLMLPDTSATAQLKTRRWKRGTT